MKKLNSLKNKINNNTEFIFYDGEQIIKDFGEQIKNEERRAGEYARLIIPNFLNETDRVIITDNADIIIKKDLLELYNYPLDDKIIKAVVDPYVTCSLQYYCFRKENFFNGGVILLNLKLWRELDIYQYLVKFYNAFQFRNKLMTPLQDILNTFLPAISIGFLPLRYNLQGFVDIFGNSYSILYDQRCFMFYIKKEELIAEEKNMVIRHFNKYKVYKGENAFDIKKDWTFYAKLTGFYDEICLKHPLGCK